MNLVSTKLYSLERNVLPELPEEGTAKITWENGDEKENITDFQIGFLRSQLRELIKEEIQYE